MKKMRLKRKIKYKKVNLILIIFVLILSASLYLLNVFSKKAVPIFLEYAEIEVKRIASLVINNSVINGVGANITLDDLFIVKEDKNGNIISMDVNPASTNKLLQEVGNILEKNFKYLEDGNLDKLKLEDLNIKTNKKGVIYELPSGIMFDNIFLNNLLPKIPVRLNIVGTIFSKLTTDVESYGINNAIFKVNLYVSTEIKVILPFTSKNVKLEASIPIIIKIIEGDVPSYYFSNLN